eukprot:CAMPEP_0184649256 /NCGR_PEP_ID=MMETSP0308-20130426/6562_1 /TAXON_ID=38269 /ORGANISM="Gloeochaete witrockiana, Strain SAG 46.84" /LENGTH=503 /DNA_ID=CAMNT_0027081815 /DNA_START=165 /DNA_END=1676 /DNA_ORIENTATION=+
MDVSIVQPTLCGDSSLPGQLRGSRDRYDPVVYGNEMYVFCPSTNDDGVPLEGVSALNLDTMTWRKVQTIGTGPCARSWHATALLENQMYIIGGMDNSGGGMDNSGDECEDVWALDLKSLVWKVVIQDKRDLADKELFGPGGDSLIAVMAKGDIYVLCFETNWLWRLSLSGSWTLLDENKKFDFWWFTGKDEMLFAVAESGTFRWDWEASCWIQINREHLINRCERMVFCPQQSPLIFCFPHDRSLKFLGREKQWLTVFESDSVPLCISAEKSSLYTMFCYRGIVVMVGWDHEKEENAVWLLSIPYHPSSYLHFPGSHFLKLVDSPHTDFKLVPKEGIEQMVPVIKVLLAVRWEWFATLLQSGMQEISLGSVDIPKSRAVVVALVKYLYGGCLPPSLPVKTLVGLSKLADMYQLNELAELSSLALRCSLSVENCVKIFRCGVKAHDSVLRWFAADYIMKCFARICLTQEYGRLVLDTQSNQAFSTHVCPDMALCRKRKLERSQE